MPESGKRFLIYILLAATASMSVAADFSDKKGFSASVGGEYQYISQQYYNSLLDTTTLDVIEIWQLTQDEINDFILKTSLGYALEKPLHRFNLLGDFQVSGDRRLGRSEAYYRYGSYDNNLDFSGKIESKTPIDGTDRRIEEYTFFDAALGGKKRLSERFSLNFKAGYEQIDFADRPADSADSLTATPIFSYLDYSLFSGAVGGVFSISESIRELSWRLGYRHRRVPDSTQAGYDQSRLELEYVDLGSRLLINLRGELELRDYFQPGGQDDFRALSFWANLSQITDRRFRVEGSVQADIYRYDIPDVVNRNYALYRAEVAGILQFGSLGWGPLVRCEYRHETPVVDVDLGSFSETYSQWEAGLKADLFSHRRFFFNSEVTYGRRDYSHVETFLSSYGLWSVAVLANYSIIDNISVNLLLDGSFENHDSQTDNADLLLLSIGVNARI